MSFDDYLRWIDASVHTCKTCLPWLGYALLAHQGLSLLTGIPAGYLLWKRKARETAGGC